jgi:hypothetical protein
MPDPAIFPIRPQFPELIVLSTSCQSNQLQLKATNPPTNQLAFF